MHGLEQYITNTKVNLRARKNDLEKICKRVQNPLDANLTKEEAIILLTARLRGDFGGMVKKRLEDWQVYSAVERAVR